MECLDFDLVVKVLYFLKGKFWEILSLGSPLYEIVYDYLFDERRGFDLLLLLLLLFNVRRARS